MAKKVKGFDMIINHMKENGSITKTEAKKLYGLDNFAQHIAYIRKLGYDVSYRNSSNGNEYFITNSYERPVKQNVTADENTQETTYTPEEMRVKTSMKEVILEHLKKHKTITSAFAMKKYKCLNLSAVIQKLKQEGWNISRTITKKNNDYNVASNRNNAYSTYTLESKTRKRTVYNLNCVCEGVISSLIPSYTSIHMTKDSAIYEAIRVVDELANRCNTFYGTSIIDFVRTVEMGQVKLYKREKIRKLFRNTFKITSLLNFIVDEAEMEV